MKTSLKVLALCVVASVVLTACETLSCPLNNIVEAHFGFYAARYDTLTGKFQPGQAVSLLETLTITACGTDSILINKITGAKQVQLPVSYYRDADTLVFKITNANGSSGTDTICFQKTNKEHFDEPSCPVNIFHEITGVHYSRNYIDTLVISNRGINYDGLENLQIYFK